MSTAATPSSSQVGGLLPSDRGARRDRLEGRAGDVATLAHHVVGEEPHMIIVLVEMLRGEHTGEDRHVGVELDPHEAADHGVMTAEWLTNLSKQVMATRKQQASNQ